MNKRNYEKTKCGDVEKCEVSNGYKGRKKKNRRGGINRGMEEGGRTVPRKKGGEI